MIKYRAERRRASRACLRCRNRKVRCDVARGGAPCTNCRLDVIQCVLSEPNRGKKTSEKMSISDDAEDESLPIPGTYGSHSSPASNDRTDDFPTLASERERSYTPCGRRGSYQAVPEAELAIASLDPSSEAHQQPSPTGPPLPPRHTGSFSDASMDTQSQRLPGYILPPPPHFSADDIEYLARKGALTIPADAFRDKLLKSYVQFVHPFMPVLDLAEFLKTICQRESTNPISLLLFQAVMFAGITFVDIESLHEQGYHSRKEASKTFFRRASLLHALNYEPDRLVLIQALLLMSYWYEAQEDEKDTWYWIGVCLSLAQVHNLHRSAENLSVSVQEKRLRKRIWWCCYIRDRLLALGIRRPARIRQDDFDVPMLTLDDFETNAFSDNPVDFLADVSAEQDPETRKTLAITTIGLARLCVCIGNILVSQYTILGSPIGHANNEAAMSARQSNGLMKEMASCDADLKAWHQSLPQCCRYNEDRDINKEVVRLHQATLHMIYHMAISTLHRPRVSRSRSNSGLSMADKRLSRQKATEAAVEITKVAYDLHERNQLRYLSSSSIPAFVSATLIHLLDIRSAREDVRNISIGRFYQCTQALQQLRDMYSSADQAVWLLETVIQDTNVQIPMLTLGGLLSWSLKPTRMETSSLNAKAMLASQSSSTFHAGWPGISINNYPTPASLEDLSASPKALHRSTHTMNARNTTALDDTSNPLMDLALEATPGNIHLNSVHSSLDDFQISSPVGDWKDTVMDQDILPALIDFGTDTDFFAMVGETTSQIPWECPDITTSCDYMNVDLTHTLDRQSLVTSESTCM